MKKRIVIVGCFATFFATATYAQTTFTIRAGANLQNINGKDAIGGILANTVTPAYNIGALINIPMADAFSIQTGAVFATKGAKTKDTFSGTERTRTVHLSYVEIPFNFMYTPTLGNGRLLLGFGPYIAFGVNGSIKSTGTTDQKVIWKSAVLSTDAGQNFYRPLESGANFLFGYEFFKHLQIQFNAQLGLTKINPNDARISNNKTVMKNTGFGVSLGWRF